MTPNEMKELDIQKSINKHVDDFNSFRFNAGAGAGKTHALIETLKYVSVNKISVTQNLQNVACITYTNVAVDEIKSRLGNSEAVHVSTIHERLWQLIKAAQPQLLICHKEKIKEVIEENNTKLYSSNEAGFFIDLQESQQQEFIEFAKQSEDLFYRSKHLKSTLFKEAYTNDTVINRPGFLDKCLKNLKNFYYVLKLLYENQKLEACLERINAGKEKRVNYDSKVNSDRLHYMKFSHDTLLEYGLKLVDTYPTLCRIVIDSYPYFFIDEYQDTHKNVIKFVKIIHDYSLENSKKWMVGYFGDTAQSIYEDGVGRDITSVHNGLCDINKIFNRRSHQQIIDVANKIRDDEIVQQPIFDDRNNGSVSFFYSKLENKLAAAQRFLAEYREDLITDNRNLDDIDNKDTKIHCLVLTNKLMASFNGFGDVYDAYSNSAIYHANLNTQVLSQQTEKLHPTILTIYNLVKLYNDIQQEKVSYYDIFGVASKYISFSKASLVIREMQINKIELLRDWIDLIINLIEKSDAKNELAHALINRIHYDQISVSSADIFRETLLDSIVALMNKDAEDADKAKEKVNSVLFLPIKSLINWVNFIDGAEDKNLSFHTYHGTKGEEYKNVAIILEHSFGSKNKDKFKNYFNTIQLNRDERDHLLSDDKFSKIYMNTQNLLYVACSRAIKNLRILYLDDISEIEKGIEAIFGESKSWPIEKSNVSV